MRSSRVRIPLKIILFVLLFALLVSLLNAFLTPMSQNQWQTLPYLYAHNDVDTVFLGTSSAYRSNIPLVVDEETGLNTCNLATPAQTLMASYYLLKEVLKTHRIKHVVLYMYITRFQDSELDPNFMYDSIEGMRFSLNKLEFMINWCEVDHFPDALFRCYRARALFQQIGAQQTDSDTATVIPDEYPVEIYPYLGKGYEFSATERPKDEITVRFIEPFDQAKISPENHQYLQKIIALCQEKSIDLILASSPRMAANILNTGNYDAFHDYVQGIAKANGIPFWDFVYVRPEVLRIEDAMFVDDHHANYKLALPLSRIMGQMLRAHIDGTLDESRYLFRDYDAYLRTNSRIAAVAAGPLDAGETLTAKAITGGDIAVQYRFLLSAERDGEYAVIQDWSTASQVDLSGQPDRLCWVLVEARQPGADGSAEKRLHVSVDLRQ